MLSTYEIEAIAAAVVRLLVAKESQEQPAQPGSFMARLKTAMEARDGKIRKQGGRA